MYKDERDQLLLENRKYKEERDQLAIENRHLTLKIKELIDQLKPKEPNSLFDSIENAFNHLQESALKPILNKIQKVCFDNAKF